MPTTNNYPITAYQILIADSVDSFTEYTSLCDGSDSTVVTNKFCQIDMNLLDDSPFSLAFQDVVKFKVVAYNARGWSEISDANTSGV